MLLSLKSLMCLSLYCPATEFQHAQSGRLRQAPTFVLLSPTYPHSDILICSTEEVRKWAWAWHSTDAQLSDSKGCSTAVCYTEIRSIPAERKTCIRASAIACFLLVWSNSLKISSGIGVTRYYLLPSSQCCQQKSFHKVFFKEKRFISHQFCAHQL